MELALVHGAVSEEDQDDSVLLLHLDAEAYADADGHLPADYGVSAHEVLLCVEQVHRAALAAARPGGPAAQLGHARLGVHTSGQRVAVVPVVSDDVVLRLKRADSANGHSFLAYVQVEEASYETLHVEPGACLFELSDEKHHPVVLGDLCLIDVQGYFHVILGV